VIKLSNAPVERQEADVKAVFLINKNYRKMIFAESVSDLGGYFYFISILWLASNITENALSISFIRLAETIPGVLFGFFIGALVDKLNKKKVSVISEWVSAALVFLVATTFFIGYLNIWVIYVAAFFLAICTRFSSTAKSAMIPKIVGKEKIQKANSYSNISGQAMSIIGNSIGGVILSAFGALYMLISTSMSMVFSGFMISRIKLDSGVEDKNKIKLKELANLGVIMSDIRAGFSYIKTKPILLVNLSMSFSLGIALSSLILVPLYIQQDLSLSAAHFGLIEALSATSMVLISFFLSKKNVKHPLLFMGFATITIGVGFVTMSLYTSLLLLLFSRIIIGSMIALFNILFITQIHTQVEDGYIARVLTVSYVFSSLLYPIFSVLSGIIASNTSIRTSWFTLGATVTVVNILLIVIGKLKLKI